MKGRRSLSNHISVTQIHKLFDQLRPMVTTHRDWSNTRKIFAHGHNAMYATYSRSTENSASRPGFGKINALELPVYSPKSSDRHLPLLPLPNHELHQYNHDISTIKKVLHHMQVTIMIHREKHTPRYVGINFLLNWLLRKSFLIRFTFILITHTFI